MVHFLGRGLEKMNLDNLGIRTLGFERLLQLKDNVSHDSWRLFTDMQKFNPYSEKARKEFLDSLNLIDKELKS